MSKTALVLVDIQKEYFEGGAMPLPAMDAAADKAAELLAKARSRGDAIFHIRHISETAEAPIFKPGTAGTEIHEKVAPSADEAVIEKARPNSFHGTELEAALREAGIENITLCGAMSQMCIDATARAAADLGFNVTVVSDACAAAPVEHDGLSLSADQVHAAIMAPLAMAYGKVVKADAV